LRSEVSNHNILVSILCPGPVESEIFDKAYTNPNDPKSERTNMMATSRCTALILKGLYYNMEEMWISDQPILFMTYMSEYTPAVFRFLMKKIGPMRVNAVKKGKNFYDPKVIDHITFVFIINVLQYRIVSMIFSGCVRFG
jgi:short-subunit dehydrogenase